MRDLYWRYVTQGVVDITPVISPQAPGWEGTTGDATSAPPNAEGVTISGSPVPTSVSAQRLTGQECATQRVSPEPPRAGRSRSAPPNADIPSVTTAGWSKGTALS